ncbi:hypothetical protein ABT234_01205 [Streptomyces sp. NPDC001586]|uniref:hypothetical protein n=1 Tax=unclassified Streptomyces TaxID=2593676 RepID=UPI0033193706
MSLLTLTFTPLVERVTVELVAELTVGGASGGEFVVMVLELESLEGPVSGPTGTHHRSRTPHDL